MSHLLLPYLPSVAFCSLPAATAELSCRVQRSISQPVTDQPQCPESNIQLCTSEEILCSCFGEGILVEWLNALFEINIVFANTGGTMVGAVSTDANTRASAVVTAVNPRDNITTYLTLNVTTTAAINASQFNNTAIRCQDVSGPPGGMEQTLLIYGRFLCAGIKMHLVEVLLLFCTYQVIHYSTCRC